MTAQTHQELVNFIWSICNLLRGPYKLNEYRKVILPMTVLRRFDCLLAPSKDAVLARHAAVSDKPDAVVQRLLAQVSGYSFYNTSKLDMKALLDDPNHCAQNLTAYVHAFSPDVREIMERFKFDQQIERMAEKNLLYEVVKKFARTDLSPERVDNVQMGYVFEELIRIGAEQSNEEAGEHYTPREVIRLMVNLLLSQEEDLRASHVVKTIYDPACGTGGMLAVAEKHIRELNADARPMLYGQELNDDAWAVSKSDMLIKGADAANIVLGDSLTNDGFRTDESGEKWVFDYMLANPPFGVEWKQQHVRIKQESESRGHAGRFGAGLPRIKDGSLLFLQHMLSKMRPAEQGGSRIAIVFNGSPLFTGGAGNGESNIRRWIIENDWLEAVVALPDQLFYNTGISTYVWILTNHKEPRRRGKIQLLDARRFFVKMPKSLGDKRNKIGDPADHDGEPDQICEIARIYGTFRDGETRSFQEDDPVTKEPIQRESVVSRVFENDDFGFRKIVVKRPLRMNFQASPERIDLLGKVPAFVKLPEQRQEQICELVEAFADRHGEGLYLDRAEFLADWRAVVREQGERQLKANERKALLEGLGERDPNAEVCRNSRGDPEPDPAFRDSEIVPLRKEVDDYLRQEVLPHVPDAWVDHKKTKIGYEIPLTRHFYCYDPPRALDKIDADITVPKNEIVALLEEVTSCKVKPYSKSKSSGLEWPGEVPEHWKRIRLKYVAILTMGQSPPSDAVQIDPVGLLFLQGCAEFGSDHPTANRYCINPPRIAQKRTILLSVRAPVGRINIADQEYGIGRGLCAVQPSPEWHDRFAYWQLHVLRDDLKKVATGSTYNAVSVDDVADLNLMIPPHTEQRAIATFLDWATGKIDALIDKAAGIDSVVRQAGTLIDRLREKRQALITAAVTGQIDVRGTQEDEKA